MVHATPTFWSKRGTLQLQADAIRMVGLGELLARIEHLRRVLAAEGLFDADRKVALPFLPAVVGLVCGRESKAEHDVVVNARERWPQVQFVIREVAVQGPRAVPEVSAAIAELDADPSVEVIVVARGGGSVEDLLPFSNEAMVRAAAACRTPLVSAIGHETDAPLLDLVADHRASTPTDAAKRIVPDVAEERLRICAGPRPHRRRRSTACCAARPSGSSSCARDPCWPHRTRCSTGTPRSSRVTGTRSDAAWTRRSGSGPPRSTGWWPRWRRCRRPRPWPGATQWSSATTARCCADPPTPRPAHACACDSQGASSPPSPQVPRTGPPTLGRPRLPTRADAPARSAPADPRPEHALLIP